MYLSSSAQAQGRQGEPQMKTQLKGYAKMIEEATGVTDEKKLAKIEDVMRNVIFHSTLDWQSKQEFNEGALAALEVVNAMAVR